MMMLTAGTPASLAVLPVLEKTGAPMLAPSTGATALYQPLQKNVFNLRASYQQEAIKSVKLLQTMALHRIALLAQNNSFGKDGATGVLKGLQDISSKPSFSLEVDTSKPDFGPAINSMRESRPDAVVFVGSAPLVIEFVKRIRSEGMTTRVLTLSNNASQGFIKGLGEHATGVIVSQVFPSERAMKIPVVREFNRVASAAGIKELSPSMLEGFVAAKVASLAIQRNGRNLTRANLLQTLNELGTVDVGGLRFRYSATDHSGLDFVDLSIIARGQFMR
jgi:branched-chain amino acid transport system substrate-binding protein